MKGVDFAYGWYQGLGAEIAASLVDGEHPAYVGRYLTYPGDGNPPAGIPPKGIFKVEVDDYHAAGLAVLFFFEVGTGEWRQGYDRGAEHGQLAKKALDDLGAPGDTVVFFAIDTDTNPADYPALFAYLDGAESVMGLPSTGVYGEADVVDACIKRGHADHAVQCEAWSGGRVSECADYYQHARYAYINGIGMDVQTSRTLDGTWQAQDAQEDDMKPEERDLLYAIAAAVTGAPGGVVQGDVAKALADWNAANNALIGGLQATNARVAALEQGWPPPDTPQGIPPHIHTLDGSSTGGVQR